MRACSTGVFRSCLLPCASILRPVPSAAAERKSAPDILNADMRTAWGEQAIALPAIYQLGPVRDKATAAKLVAILEDHGWLVPIVGGAEVAGQRRRQAWQNVRG